MNHNEINWRIQKLAAANYEPFKVDSWEENEYYGNTEAVSLIFSITYRMPIRIPLKCLPIITADEIRDSVMGHLAFKPQSSNSEYWQRYVQKQWLGAFSWGALYSAILGLLIQVIVRYCGI